MPAPHASVFAAVLARYGETGAAALAKAFLHEAPLKDPATQDFLAVPYVVIGDGGEQGSETFEYHALLTRTVTVTVYALSQADAARVARLARWNNQPPLNGAGLDHAELSVAGHRVLACWCSHNTRTGQDAARDGTARPVFTHAFDCVVSLLRDATEVPS